MQRVGAATKKALVPIFASTPVFVNNLCQSIPDSERLFTETGVICKESIVCIMFFMWHVIGTANGPEECGQRELVGWSSRMCSDIPYLT